MSFAMALIDANNFYAACEQSFDPSLLGRPVVVLSNNDGCIVARNPEARALGICMGTPYFRIRQKLERLKVVVRSSNYALYGDMSQRLMRSLESHCEELEIYSIDEAFVRLSRPCDFNLRDWACRLRSLVYRNLGLPIAVGFGANKSQAKLANYLAKVVPANAGIFNFLTLSDREKRELLENVAVEELWGVGPKLARWCRSRGVCTARQFRDMSSGQLLSKYGVVGLRLQSELRGVVCWPIAKTAAPKKETCVSRSFGQPITSLEDLQQAIATYVVRAGEKLRRQRQLAGALTVFIRTSAFSSPFYSESATVQFHMPSNDTGVLLTASIPLVKKIFRPCCRFTKAGVLMHHLQGAEHLQQSLLLESTLEDQKRRERLMTAIDRLNGRYGRGTIGWAVCGTESDSTWSMRRDQLSRAFTTCLDDVPIVMA